MNKIRILTSVLALTIADFTYSDTVTCNSIYKSCEYSGGGEMIIWVLRTILY